MNDIYKVTDDDLLEAWKTSNDLFKEYLRTNGYEHNAIKFFCRHTEIPVVIHKPSIPDDGISPTDKPLIAAFSLYELEDEMQRRENVRDEMAMEYRKHLKIVE